MNPKFWYLLAGLTAMIALIIALVMIFATSTGPRGYVANNYQRAAQLDNRGSSQSTAYTDSKSPSQVSRDIVSRWRPVSQATDASGIYLRYPDDAVIIQPRRGGSVIHVMDDADAYRRYHAHVGGIWGWAGTYGDSFRGRGPGAGK